MPKLARPSLNRLLFVVLVISVILIQGLIITGYLSSRHATAQVTDSSAELASVSNVHRDTLMLIGIYAQGASASSEKLSTRRAVLQRQLDVLQTHEDHNPVIRDKRREVLATLNHLDQLTVTTTASGALTPEVQQQTQDLERAAKELYDSIERKYLDSMQLVVASQERSQTRLLLAAPLSAVVGFALLFSIRRQARTELQEAVKNNERRMRNVLSNVTETVFETDSAWKWTFLSASWEELTGRSVEASIGDSLDSIADTPSGAPKVIKGVLDSGVPEELEIMLDDGQTRWISVSARSYTNEAGEVVGSTGILTDVTELRSARLHEAQAQRLQSVGSLAAGIAHEINTPMQFIGDNLRFLDEAFTAMRSSDEEEKQFYEDEVPTAMRDAAEGVRRVTEIVQAIKSFGHPGTGEHARADLNEAITSTTIVARNEYKLIADLILDLDESLPEISCNSGDIKQVLLNLVVNASHAIESMHEGTSRGTISITSRQLDSSSALIEVTDTGCGMDAATQERIFDPFFTTKEVGKGTGQGLALSRSLIVDRHGGSLTVRSQPGHGSTFSIILPIAHAATSEVPEGSLASSA